jgi:hypothetical protein
MKTKLLRKLRKQTDNQIRMIYLGDDLFGLQQSVKYIDALSFDSHYVWEIIQTGEYRIIYKEYKNQYLLMFKQNLKDYLIRHPRIVK